jgi:hypothetical protein
MQNLARIFGRIMMVIGIAAVSLVVGTWGILFFGYWTIELAISVFGYWEGFYLLIWTLPIWILIVAVAFHMIKTVYRTITDYEATWG